MKKAECSIGIIAYNEEKNIGQLLDSIRAQNLKDVVIKERIVVASSCTDKTEAIVKDFSLKDERIKLITQEKREGKSSAVNLYIKTTKEELCVLSSADILLAPDTIENLVNKFGDQSIGMVGCHPVPVNDPDKFLGFVEHVRWRITHELASWRPRLGEMVAFRRVIDSIPVESAVDEASIEGLIISKGYRLAYAADAVIYNKGSETVNDFIKQRRRIYAGHCYLRDHYDYTVSSFTFKITFTLFLKETYRNLKFFLWTISAVFLEGYSRFLGMVDYYLKKKNPYIWEISESTKDLSKK